MPLTRGATKEGDVSVAYQIPGFCNLLVDVILKLGVDVGLEVSVRVLVHIRY